MPVSADRRLTSGHARTVRAAFVGALTTGLGVGAHEAAGGAAPSLGALGAITVGVGALAWMLSGQRWTPRTLLAAFLLTQGAVHGVSMAQHPAVLVAHFAAMKLGAVSVPLFTLFGEEALAFRLADSGAAALVTDAANLDKAMALISAADDMQAAAGDGLDALRGAIGPVGKSCGGCHEDFRLDD